MPDWCVALVSGGSVGDAVASKLSDLGLSCYRPKYREMVVARGRKVWREGYLLGRYLLIQLRMVVDGLGRMTADWARQFHEVVSTRGVRGVLAVDDAPLLVRGAEVDRIRSSERKGFVTLARRSFAHNQRVVVRSGAFEYLTGTYRFSCDRFDYVEIDGLLARVVRVPVGSIEAV